MCHRIHSYDCIGNASNKHSRSLDYDHFPWIRQRPSTKLTTLLKKRVSTEPMSEQEIHRSLSSLLATRPFSPIFDSVERILSTETVIMVDELSSISDDEYFMASPTEYSHSELHAGLWTTRICGIITLISSLCTIWRAWNRREGLFHRLVLGKL